MSCLICFIDGLGLTQPSLAPWASARLPTWTQLLDAVPHAGLVVDRAACVFQAIDATLGVKGLPQSGTGHTTLWTGINAAALLGRHYPAYPAPSQRPLLAQHSLFQQIQTLGGRVVIATVHRADYWTLVAQRQQRATAIAFAARAAELELPTVAEYLAGRAVPWDITGIYLQRWGALVGLPTLDPDEAGRRLARLLKAADLVHYECYLPDFVGHQRIDETPERVLELVDSLLGGILAELDPADSLVLVSDHGNLEEPHHKNHTTNPVPLLVVGPLAQFARSVKDISQIAGLVLRGFTEQKNEIPAC